MYQGGGIEQSRTFGGTPTTVTTYAGAFLDGLQQHGIAGTLKHWPGLRLQRQSRLHPAHRYAYQGATRRD